VSLKAGGTVDYCQ